MRHRAILCECTRGGSYERLELSTQPLESSYGAEGDRLALHGLELIVEVEEARINFGNSLVMPKILFAPSTYTLQVHALEWACPLLTYSSQESTWPNGTFPLVLHLPDMAHSAATFILDMF